MKKTIISLSVLFIGCTEISAQVGVGTSNPRNSFHIDGGKNNNVTGDPTTAQQQDDVIITSLGQIGIGTTAPSAKLDINSSTSPAIRIIDGTQGANKILTSDANGNGSWISTTATKPTIGGVLPTTTPDVAGVNWVYLNSNITLPPGNWLVQMGTTLIKLDGNSNVSWIHFSLSDSQTAFNYTPDIDGTRSGSQAAGATGPAGAIFSFASGILAINNTSGANKTYYLWSRRADGSGTVVSPMSSSKLERYFYAIPVN